MSKVDWSTAPDGAEFYANGEFWQNGGFYAFIYDDEVGRFINTGALVKDVLRAADYEIRQPQWPESESRMDAIGRNGNDGIHYEQTPKTASDFLSDGLRILEQRGSEYDPNGKKERSFPEIAQAFNAIRGKDLSGSDVCLILVLLKLVRQSATKDFHMDSAVDGINYAALYAEALLMESQS